MGMRGGGGRGCEGRGGDGGELGGEGGREIPVRRKSKSFVGAAQKCLLR